jgi:Protein of unknown function (DUF1153)
MHAPWHGSCEFGPEVFPKGTTMNAQSSTKLSYVTGADGSPLTPHNLPRANTKRWSIRRKANVVAAVRGGLIDLDEACARYRLSVEEFLAWSNAVDRHGILGLRTTKIQEYRRKVEIT